ncbi:MAG TPA: hypothetical protein VF339_16090 [Gammaproteobacteria bacterium]
MGSILFANGNNMDRYGRLVAAELDLTPPHRGEAPPERRAGQFEAEDRVYWTGVYRRPRQHVRIVTPVRALQLR